MPPSKYINRIGHLYYFIEVIMKKLSYILILVLISIIPQVYSYDNCTSNYEKRCHNSDVWWYDSCGNRLGLEDECRSYEDCDDGECVRDCDRESEKRCYNNDVWWYDSCGERDYKYRNCEFDCEDGRCIDDIYPTYRRCGNGYCESGESCQTCQSDCGRCLYVTVNPVLTKNKPAEIITIVTPAVINTVQPNNQDTIFIGDIGTLILILLIVIIFIAVIFLFAALLRKR